MKNFGMFSFWVVKVCINISIFYQAYYLPIAIIHSEIRRHPLLCQENHKSTVVLFLVLKAASASVAASAVAW